MSVCHSVSCLTCSRISHGAAYASHRCSVLLARLLALLAELARPRTSTSRPFPRATRSSSRSTTARTSRWSARRATVTLQEGRQPAAVHLGQHADRSDERRAEVPHAGRQAGRARHDLPARQAADAVLERAERVRRRSDDPDHLLHQRHHLDGRLHLRSPTRTRRTSSFEGFVRVYNNSGEEYENAQVRLVVGTINLVEKIAQLAQMPIADVAKMQAEKLEELKKDVDAPLHGAGRAAWAAARAARRMPSKRRSSRKGSASTSSTRSKGPRRSPTAGRSGCGRSKAQTVPFKIQYRYRPQEYGDQLVRMYLLTNDEESQARHDAAARRHRPRLPRQRPRRAVVPDAAADQVHPDRRQDRAEPGRRSGSDLRADQAPRRSATNCRLQIHGTNEFRKVGGDEVIKQENAIARRLGRPRDLHASGFATTRASRSTSKSAARLPGHVVFRSQLEPKLHDYQTVAVPDQGRRRQAGRPAVRGRPQARHQRQAEQRHARNRRR